MRSELLREICQHSEAGDGAWDLFTGGEICLLLYYFEDRLGLQCQGKTISNLGLHSITKCLT